MKDKFSAAYIMKMMKRGEETVFEEGLFEEGLKSVRWSIPKSRSLQI